MNEMNGFESLSRGILWLGKRDWGLSSLLGFASLCAVAWIGAQWPETDHSLFEGPVFKTGFYVGTIFFPDYATRGTTGFYLVHVFGVTANFLVLMAFWYIVIWAVRQVRTASKANDLRQS